MKNLLTALARFQQECPVIVKATKGYNYKYADLPTIIEQIKSLLKKHGLMFTQPLTERGVKTIIFHVDSGETLESEMTIPEEKLQKMNDYQSLGSGVTYIRRYMLSSVLGLVTDEDNDAAGNPKEYMCISHNRFASALQAVKNGKITIEKIKEKFNLSLTAEDQLKRATNEK